MKYDEKDKSVDIIYKNFIGGISWIAGVTIGFTLLISLLSFILNKLGALPVIGKFFAAIVVATEKAIQTRIIVK